MNDAVRIALACAWTLGGAAALPRVLPRRPDDADVGEARAFAGAVGGLLLFAALTTAVRGGDPTTESALLLGAHAIVLGFLAAFLRRPEAPFRAGPALADVARGVVAYACVVPAVVALNAWNVRFAPTGDGPPPEALVALAEGPLDIRFAFLAATVVVLVPWSEEIFARGLLQRGAASAFGRAYGPRAAGAGAVVVASLAFTALHPPSSYVPVFVLSLALGAIARRTGGVAAAVGFHAAHNAYAVAYERGLKHWLAAASAG